MENINYNCTFTVNNTPQEVYDNICKVSQWWGDVTGDTQHLNGEFRYTIGDTYVDFRITEMVPGKKIVWLVTDCNLHWLQDKKEWNGTRLNFDIAEIPSGTSMTMTHIGLTPQIECYANCRQGWDFYAGNSLRQLITQGAGKPGPRNK